jgi:hypothetical protein
MGKKTIKFDPGAVLDRVIASGRIGGLNPIEILDTIFVL